MASSSAAIAMPPSQSQEPPRSKSKGKSKDKDKSKSKSKSRKGDTTQSIDIPSNSFPPQSQSSPTAPHGTATSPSVISQHSVSQQSQTASYESVYTDEEEKLSDYEQGGYHPVIVGETFSNGRYVVVRKLGWGHFSTVWLARDSLHNRHVALKVVKSAQHYTETALDEIKLLQKVVSSDPNHPGRRHVVSLLDHFTHEGMNGSHVCMVFEVLGENLLGLIKRYQNRGVPEHIVRQIAKQALLGLDYIHRCCGIIHTDLKPENVLICIDDVEAVVKAELETTPAAVPTKLVGVPPSQGRGGTQTPRGEGIFITGSQPLPSPSSSFLGTSPMIDKLGFHMSKISDTASTTKNSPSGPSYMQSGLTSATPSNAGSKVNLSGMNNNNNAPSSIASSPKLPLSLSSSEENVSDAIARTRISSAGGGSINEVLNQAEEEAKREANKLQTNTNNGPSLLSQQALKHKQILQAEQQQQGTDSAGTIPHYSSYSPPPIYKKGADGQLILEKQDPQLSIDQRMTSPDLHQEGEDPAITAANDNVAAMVDELLQQYRPAPVAGDPSTLPPNAPYDPASLERITVKIADLGNASWVDLHFTNDIQTRQYRSPEAIIGAKWGTPVDMWSAACMFFELLTGDYLFDPAAGSRYNKDDDHIAQIIELMGPFPRHIALSGKYSSEIFTRKAELRHISRLKYWPLKSVLTEKYLIPEEDADVLSHFLEPMLLLDPAKRATAKDMLEEPWLEGVIVQGEEDLMQLRRNTSSGMVKELNAEEKEVMKPVLGGGL